MSVALRELVELQLDHRSSPKEERLLNLLSGDTSSAPADGSTSPRPPKKMQNDERLIAAVMARGKMSREEAIAELDTIGAL